MYLHIYLCRKPLVIISSYFIDAAVHCNMQVINTPFPKMSLSFIAAINNVTFHDSCHYFKLTGVLESLDNTRLSLNRFIHLHLK